MRRHLEAAALRSAAQRHSETGGHRREENHAGVAGEREQPRCSIGIRYVGSNRDVIEIVAERLGWELTHDGGTVVWAIFKDDLCRCLQQLRDGQSLSHVPGIYEACNKVALSSSLERAGCDFWPRAWRLPEAGLDEICAELRTSGGDWTVIVKPDTGSQGRGISLACTANDLRRQVARLQAPEAIVQEYVGNPLLLDGYKWDMRIYVLVIPSPNGLSCFLAQDGLVRVCIDQYELPNDRNLHRLTTHLTNYSISKLSEKFEASRAPGDSSQGCKRLLSAVLRRLETETRGRLCAQQLLQSLASLARATVSAMTEHILAVAFQSETWDGSAEVAGLARKRFGQCFQIIGLDVLLDSNGKPWLLEVNNNPSMSIDEVRPLPGVKTRAEANLIFAAAKRDRRASSKWGRPCRCKEHPRPHAHHRCSTDVAVKVPVVEGALVIARRFYKGEGCSLTGACDGTIYRSV